MAITRKTLAARHSVRAYSVLSALIGDIDAARAAGIIAAKNEQIASAAAATISANGSQDFTP
jgi:hypothetical protein